MPHYRVPSKTDHMSHLGTSLLPMVSLVAVPNTPPPTPPPPLRKKNILGKRKKHKRSPILPAMIAAHKATTAVGMPMLYEGDDNVFNVDDLEDGEEFESIFDEQDEEGHYATVGHEANYKTRPAIESPVAKVDATALGDAPDNDTYAVVNKISSPSSSRSPKYLEKKHRDLEKRLNHQNDETKGIVMEMMKQQHKSSIKQEQVLKELDSIANERDMLEEERKTLMAQNEKLIKQNTALAGKDKGMHNLSKLLNIEDEESQGIISSRIHNIVDENNTLKESVHRLNVELSRFQSKYGEIPTSKEAHGLPSSGPRPPWLTDSRYLTPLFVSYDAQLKQKDETIAEYSVQLKELKQQVLVIAKENEILHAAAEEVKSEPYISQQKWNNIKSQNELMVEEIQIMVQQLKMAETKSKTFRQAHISEVCELTKKVSILEAENQQYKDEQRNLKKEIDDLRHEFEQLEIDASKKVPAADHVSAINACKREYDDLKENYEYEIKKLFKKIKDSEEEKKTQMLEVAEQKSVNKQLEGNIKALDNSIKKYQNKEEDLQNELYNAKDKIREFERHLADVIRVAEKASAEKEVLSALVDKEQRLTHAALQKSMRGKYEIEKLEKTLKEYQRDSQGKFNDVSHTINILQENHESRLKESNREMAHLRHLLHEKQVNAEKANEERRLLEVQLDSVWQAAANENRLIMGALYKSNVL